MKPVPTLSVLFSFPGFRARSRLQGVFGDPHARLLVLVRRKKLPCARAGERGTALSTTARHAGCAIRMPPAGGSTWRLSSRGWPARAAGGEGGAARLDGPESALYTTVRTPSRHLVSGHVEQGRRADAASARADGQKPGYPVHAGVVGQDAAAGPAGYWRR